MEGSLKGSKLGLLSTVYTNIDIIVDSELGMM